MYVVRIVVPSGTPDFTWSAFPVSIVNGGRTLDLSLESLTTVGRGDGTLATGPFFFTRNALCVSDASPRYKGPGIPTRRDFMLERG